MPLVPQCDHCTSTRDVEHFRVRVELLEKKEDGLFGPIGTQAAVVVCEDLYLCKRHRIRTAWFVARGVLKPGQRPVMENEYGEESSAKDQGTRSSGKVGGEAAA